MAKPDILEPVVSGVQVAQNDYVAITCSNMQYGYGMVRFNVDTTSELENADYRCNDELYVQPVSR